MAIYVAGDPNGAPQWEYRVLTYSSHTEPYLIERDLDDFGRAGWELISASPWDGGNEKTNLFLKRPRNMS